MLLDTCVCAVIAELEGLSKGAGDGGEERERKDGRGKKVMADTR